MGNSLLNQHFNLLQGTFFTSLKDKKPFLIVKGFLKDNAWNLVVPKVAAKKIDLDFLEEFINKAKDKRDFSFYISKDLNSSYSKMLTSRNWKMSFTDVYIYKNLDEKFPVKLKNNEIFKQVDNEIYSEYIKQAKQIFHDYENAIEYTTSFYKFGTQKAQKELRSFVIKNSKDIICFQSMIYSKELNLAYLHNGGTNEKYRRQGYFIKLNKLMFNYLLDNGITKVYGLVEEDSNSYNAFKKLSFAESSKYYIYSKE